MLATALAYALYARAAWPWIALGFVGLVPFLAVLERAPSLRRALALGAAMAIAFELAVYGWFAGAIAAYAHLPTAAAALLLTAVAPLLQPEFLAFAAVRHRVRTVGGGRVRAAIAAAGAWVGAEWAVGKLFGDTLGYPLWGAAWLRQAADVAGAPGLTVVLLLTNEGVLAATVALAGPRGAPWSTRLRAAARPAAIAIVVVAALAAYGAWRQRQYATPAPGAAPLTAGVVQADVARYDRMREEMGTYDAVRTILDAQLALSEDALARGSLDLLVWPETVYPTTFGAPKSEAGAAFDREIAGFVAATGVPLVFGSYDLEDGREYNAAFFLAPDGTWAAYRKAWLFPLTERVPAWLDTPWVRARLPWLGTWKPGAGPRVVPVRLADGRIVRVAPLICYDVLAPAHALAEVRAGADLIVTLSNDSWLLAGAGPQLHLLGAAFLSIETRRPQLRATPTGVSAVFDATGEAIALAGVHERRALVATVVPDGRPTTLRLLWGDWLGPVGLVMAGLALLAAARDRHATPRAR